VLALDAAGIARLEPASADPVDPAHDEAFVTLHEQLFPGTYYSGRQLLDMAARGDAVVLGVADADALVGYAAGRIDESGDGYLDFVGVAESHRRQGHGSTLVRAISLELDARGAIDEVRLTVRSENEAGLALYDALGFAPASSLVGYRRAAESRP
jgi:ribosomal protein S18 acetylase RimI-like enzyme